MSGPLVLAYHAVASCPNALAVAALSLELQVRGLLRRGHRPVTFAEAVAGPPSAGAGRRRLFAVTFDDGFRSVITRALPILDRLAVPATVFLPTALLPERVSGDDRPLAWPGFTPSPMTEDELLPMSWEQVGGLVERGWEIASHTATHPRLTSLDDRRLAHELTSSRLVCEQRTGTACRTIAYPFGDVDDRVVAAAAQAGYTGGAAMSRLRCAGPLAVPRTGVYSHDTPRRFRLKTTPLVRSAPAEKALSRWHGVR